MTSAFDLRDREHTIEGLLTIRQNSSLRQ